MMVIHLFLSLFWLKTPKSQRKTTTSWFSLLGNTCFWLENLEFPRALGSKRWVFALICDPSKKLRKKVPDRFSKTGCYFGGGAWPFFWESILDRVVFFAWWLYKAMLKVVYLSCDCSPCQRLIPSKFLNLMDFGIFCFLEKRWDGSKIPRKSMEGTLEIFSVKIGHWNATWIGAYHGEIVAGNCDGVFRSLKGLCHVPPPHSIPTLFDTVSKVSNV